MPPPWADPGNNPCATQPGGWQLLYWPGDGKCYKIFHQGPPCPPSMELTPGANRTAHCRCPPGTAQHAHDSLCHSLYSTGPCPRGQYFAPVQQSVSLSLIKSPQWHEDIKLSFTFVKPPLGYLNYKTSRLSKAI